MPPNLRLLLPGATIDLAADAGRRLTEVMRDADLPLNTRCGEHGTCEGCELHLVEGRLVSHDGQPIAAPATFRGCRALLGDHPLTVLRVPQRSLLVQQASAISDFTLLVGRRHDPVMPASPAAAGERVLGAAIDIGTTTVAVLLIDLASGEVLARASQFNQQMQLGDDVVTRITLCSQPGQLLRLQQLVTTSTIVPLLRQVLREAGAKPQQLHTLVAAGNTTMLHLLLAVDPTSMGVSPFTPAFLDHRVVSAASLLGQAVHPEAQLHLLPGGAAYVGADLIAGAYATALHLDEGPTLLVDVGTNGEIILCAHGRLTGCATAAGPAFEGAGLLSGIRAGPGAVSRLKVFAGGQAPEVDWIGRAQGAVPAGLCGSAYVDLLGSGRSAGLLNASGRFVQDGLPADFFLPLDGGDLAYRVPTPSTQPILISQHDVSRLLQAKAAIAAGITCLLRHAGLAPADVRSLHLAGGFGSKMDREMAIACGMLPGFTPTQVKPVGNTSLAGAYLALLDRAALPEMSRLAGRLEIIELNLHPDFETEYVDSLFLP